MKHSKTIVPLILLLGLTLNSFSQSLENFNDVLAVKKIGKVFTKKAGKDISQRTYLGTITDNRGNFKYYVVMEFLKIQAAIVSHGHSRILFFNKQQKLAEQVRLSLPEELPFKLKDNFLYFNYSDRGLNKIFVQNIAILPKMICVEPKSCYGVSNP